MRRRPNIRTLCFEQLENRELLDGTNYFVATTGNDSSDGLTPATAWRSVLRATRNSSLLPGDTINILPGVYTNDGVDTLVNGAAGRPITVRADGGPVTIQGGLLTNAWTLYDAASNVYELNVDDTGLIPYWTFCGYATTAYGYGAMTNIGNVFQGNLADPAGNYNFNCDPTCPSQLLDPPPQLANKCFFFWTGSLTGNYSSGTKLYLHAPPGWTQQDVSTNVFIGDASKEVSVNNSNWTFDHLDVADSYDGFVISNDNVTITNCSIQDIYNQSCLGEGNGLIFEHNVVQSVGQEYTPAPTSTPAITISKPSGLPETVQFSHDSDGNLHTTLTEDGELIGDFRTSPSQTVSDLAEFLQGLGYTVSVAGDAAGSSQYLVDSQPIDVSSPQTFQSASWTLAYPYGSWYQGVYFGGDNSIISNCVFRNINGNGISYRFGNNFTIANNLVDNDLGGLLNVGGTNVAVYNNIFSSTVNAGNGINLGYGGNGGTIEFEPNTVLVSNRTTLGFFETAGGAGTSNWAIADNIFANILPGDQTPIEMYVSTTPDSTLATWKLHDNVYWVGDGNGNPLAFHFFLFAQSADGVANGTIYTSWSDYYAATSQLWGWEQGSLNIDPQLNADYMPQNPSAIALGVGAVLQNAAAWSSTSDPASSNAVFGIDNVVGPLIATSIPPQLDDTNDVTSAAPNLNALNLSASNDATGGSETQTIASPGTEALSGGNDTGTSGTAVETGASTVATSTALPEGSTGSLASDSSAANSADSDAVPPITPTFVNPQVIVPARNVPMPASDTSPIGPKSPATVAANSPISMAAIGVPFSHSKMASTRTQRAASAETAAPHRIESTVVTASAWLAISEYPTQRQDSSENDRISAIDALMFLDYGRN